MCTDAVKTLMIHNETVRDTRTYRHEKEVSGVLGVVSYEWPREGFFLACCRRARSDSEQCE